MTLDQTDISKKAKTLFDNSNFDGVIKLLSNKKNLACLTNEENRLLGLSYFLERNSFIESLEYMLKITEKKMDDFLYIALNYMNLKKWDQAVNNLELAIHNDNPVVYYVLACAKYHLPHAKTVEIKDYLIKALDLGLLDHINDSLYKYFPTEYDLFVFFKHACLDKVANVVNTKELVPVYLESQLQFLEISSQTVVTSNEDIKNSLNKIPKDNLKNFVFDFWNNPTQNMNNLKEKYSISKTISYSDIIKGYPTDIYRNFLKDFYSPEISIDNLNQKYGLTLEKINSLVLDINFVVPDYPCPHCFHAEQLIKKDITKNIISLVCHHCKKPIKKRLHLKFAKKLEDLKNHIYDSFLNQINNVKQALSNLSCPGCRNNSFHVDDNFVENSIAINCKVCNGSWPHLEDLIREYEASLQRAAMMFNIRQREEELIAKALKTKRPINLLLNQEQLITQRECNQIILNSISEQENSLDYWKLLYRNMKACNRSEKVVLKTLIGLCKECDHQLTWQDNNGNTAPFYRFSNEEPVISVLFEKLKLLNIRSIIRKLIEKNLVVCDEEQNFIDLYEAIVKNESKFDELIKPQNISNDIKYLVIKRQNYACYHCGDDNKPLRIAYLSLDKNPSNLDGMVGICTWCYDDITNSEVIIDGTITVTEQMVQKGDEYVSWRFVMLYMPEINTDNAHRLHIEVLNNWDEGEILKALAITLQYMNEGKIDIPNEKRFYTYVEGILRKSNGGVRVHSKIADTYKLDEWLSMI